MEGNIDSPVEAYTFSNTEVLFIGTDRDAVHEAYMSYHSLYGNASEATETTSV